MTTAAPFLPSDRRGRVSFGLLAAGLVLYLFLFRDTLIDDAFITLSYARSLVTSATWGFYPDHVSNTATSPFNVMLLALASLVTRNPVASVFVLTWPLPARRSRSPALGSHLRRVPRPLVSLFLGVSGLASP